MLLLLTTRKAVRNAIASLAMLGIVGATVSMTVSSGMATGVLGGGALAIGLTLAVLYVLDRDRDARESVESALRQSDSQLQIATAQLPVIFWTTDVTLRLTDAFGSKHVLGEEIFKESVGKTLLDIFGTTDETVPAIAAHHLALQGEEGKYELRIDRRTFEVNVEPLRSSGGDITGCVALAVDVTERRQNEEQTRAVNHQLELRVAERTEQLEETNRSLNEEMAERKRIDATLRESESRFRLMADSSPVMIWLTDADKNLLYANKGFLEFTGKSLHELFAQNWDGLVHAADAETRWRTYHAAVDARLRFKMEYRLLSADGNYRWILDTGTPRFHVSAADGGDGDFAGYIGSCIDISDRRFAEEKIKELNADLETRVVLRTEELEVANRELEAFSYSVSHDLRAPLYNIEGFSQVLLDNYAHLLDDEGRAHLGRIRLSAQQMTQLINAMLNLARVSKTEMRREPVDVSNLAYLMLSEFHRRTPERKVEWTIGEGMMTDADPYLVRIALENLLGNAWKFTRYISPAKIEFGLLKDDAECRVKYAKHFGDLSSDKPVYFVRDNGAGFKMTAADKLFTAFHRLHSVSEFEGTGIGLATVHRIINRHGGAICAESEPGKGATFYFTLS